MAKIGVILSGCGNMDGSEIHESVLTLLFLDREGAVVQCMAPDMEQKNVISFLTGKATDNKRNVLEESARIARGNIKDIRDVSANDLDGLIIPGGSGPITNLSDFAEKGTACSLNGDVRKMIRDMHAAGKPIGAICIAPVTLIKALQDKDPEVTIGTDTDTAQKSETMGGKHIPRAVDEIHVDYANKLVTTPAYMTGPGIKDIAEGIEKLVSKVMEMAG